MFPKDSAFAQPTVRVARVRQPDVELVRAAQTDDTVSIPRSELEDIIADLNHLGARLDLSPVGPNRRVSHHAAPDHRDTDEIVNRLSSYFKG